MIYELEIIDGLYKLFKKIQKKNKQVLKIINKKVEEIQKNPYYYKPLRAPMQHMRRVHIYKHFILIYSINEKRKTIILELFDHHDNAYHK